MFVLLNLVNPRILFFIQSDKIYGAIETIWLVRATLLPQIFRKLGELDCYDEK
ncbi:hypothetical protein [Coleofasciculus sp. H7-2]|uniref:hypothetical protein n=1 Tax=Coleofasciculus sp. H7-2 TaxID=3351545 RepID=UPI00366AF14F